MCLVSRLKIYQSLFLLKDNHKFYQRILIVSNIPWQKSMT